MSWQEVKTSGNKPKGFPRLEVVHPLSILVDGSIKDPKDLQYARYIIREVGFMPIRWAKKEYGEEYGNAVLAGFNRDEGEDPDISNDDSLTFMLLHVWTRENEYDNLQLIEMDANGLILRESDPSEPYYKFLQLIFVSPETARE